MPIKRPLCAIAAALLASPAAAQYAPSDYADTYLRNLPTTDPYGGTRGSRDGSAPELVLVRQPTDAEKREIAAKLADGLAWRRKRFGDDYASTWFKSALRQEFRRRGILEER